MKKTLFLSVILGAALCSTAMAADADVNYTPAGWTEVLIQSNKIGYYSNNLPSSVNPGVWDATIAATGNRREITTALDPDLGTIILAAGSTNQHSNFTTGQLWVNAKNDTPINLTNNLVIGKSAYTEGNVFGGAAIRLASESAAASAELSGTITVVQDAKIGIQGTNNTISGDIVGAGSTLTLGGYGGGSVNVTSASVKLGGLIHMNSGSVTFGTASTVATMDGTISNEAGNLTLNGAYTFNEGDLSHYAFKSGEVIYSDGTQGIKTYKAGSIYYAIKGDNISYGENFSVTGATASATGYDLTSTKDWVSTVYAVNESAATISGTAAETVAVNTDSTITLNGITHLTSDDVALNDNTITLKLTNGTTFNGAKVSNGTGFLKNATVSVDGTSKLVLTNNDALGWGGSAVSKILLEGSDAQHVATLQLNDTQTMTTTLALNGHALITGSAFNPYANTAGGATDITASGTNNIISSEMRLRRSVNVTVEAAGELKVTGALALNGDNRGDNILLQKKGNGLLTLAGNINTRGTIDGANTTTIESAQITAADNASLTLKNVAFSNGMHTVTNAIKLAGTIDVLTTATATEVALESGNGYGSLKYLNVAFLTGNGSADVTGVTQWKINGQDVTDTAYLNGAITTATLSSSNVYYVNDASASIGLTKDTVMAAKEQTSNMFVGLNNHTLTLTGSETIFNIEDAGSATGHGEGFWGTGTIIVEDGATLNVRVGESDGLSVQNATITMTNANFGHNGNQNSGQYEATSINGDVLVTDTKVNAYKFTGGTLTLDSGQETNVTTVVMNDVVVESGTTAVISGWEYGATTKKDVHAASINAANAAVKIAEDVTFTVASDAAIGSLTLADRATLTMVSESDTARTAEIPHTVTLTELNAGHGAVINGNLELTDDAHIALDDILTVNGTLTLGSGITLSDSMTETLAGLNLGGSLTLFDGVTEFIGFTDEVAAETYFTGMPEILVDPGYSFVVSFKDNTVSLNVVPEPATATLSLLALAGLAARRRRH